jgi:hypothetical protein
MNDKRRGQMSRNYKSRRILHITCRLSQWSVLETVVINVCMYLANGPFLEQTEEFLCTQGGGMRSWRWAAGLFSKWGSMTGHVTSCSVFPTEWCQWPSSSPSWLCYTQLWFSSPQQRIISVYLSSFGKLAVGLMKPIWPGTSSFLHPSWLTSWVPS